MQYSLSGAFAHFTVPQLLLVLTVTVMFLITFFIITILFQYKIRRDLADALAKAEGKKPERIYDIQDDVLRDEL